MTLYPATFTNKATTMNKELIEKLKFRVAEYDKNYTPHGLGRNENPSRLDICIDDVRVIVAALEGLEQAREAVKSQAVAIAAEYEYRLIASTFGGSKMELETHCIERGQRNWNKCLTDQARAFLDEYKINE